MLTPLVPEPERILFQAATAPSLAAHVEAVAAVNPIYARLREAAHNRLANRRSKGPRRGGDRNLDARIIANLERARALPSSGRYIIVDAATAILSMYEDGEARDTMKVIVGKPDTPTPQIASLIHYVTLNPYWNIPKDVARSNVAPFVVKYGTSVLREMRYELVSDWSERAMVLDPSTIDWKAVVAGKETVHLRQQPGPGNMMGAVKFGFANEFGVYLHDTPKKELFAQARRNFSLGCVRVEDAKRLARWILGSEPVAATDEPEQYVQLAQPVPIYITYLTARAEGGRLAFVDDVYGRDSGRPKTGPKLAEVELATASPSHPVPTPH
jgi:murein L,D-transpeptidase YcbB/YkuD